MSYLDLARSYDNPVERKKAVFRAVECLDVVLKAEVARLVSEQNLPSCPYDGKPCLTPERGCSVGTFGVLGNDVVWRCSRLKDGASC